MTSIRTQSNRSYKGTVLAMVINDTHQFERLGPLLVLAHRHSTLNSSQNPEDAALRELRARLEAKFWPAILPILLQKVHGGLSESSAPTLDSRGTI